MLPRDVCLKFRRLSSLARRRRSLIVASAVLVCSAAWAVEQGDSEVDSGWAVGTPASAVMESTTPDGQMQRILQHVLEKPHVPLMRRAGSTTGQAAKSVLRLAERPAADGSSQASRLPGQPLPAPRTSPATRSTFKAELLPSVVGPAATSPRSAASTTTAEGPQLHPPTEAASSSSSTDDEMACDGQAASPSAAPKPAESESADEGVAPAEDEELTELPAAEAESEETLDEEAVDESADGSAPQPDVETESSDEPADSSGDAEAAAPAIAPPAERTPPPPLTRQLVNLRSRVRSVLKGYYRKPLNSREHDCWEVMHGMLSYGIHSRVLQGSPRGEPITAVGWLCYNKPCKGLTLLYATPQGELRAKWGVGLQGHTGQLLAMLAQCKVSPDYPIHVGNHAFTIRDLIEAEQKTCYPKSELTFKLLAFQQYLDLNEEWVNDQGLEWDIPRLIREELAQPIRGAACGGTHRLSGLSLTVKARQRRGEPLDGEYARAAEFVEKYEKYAFRLQNRDGSLSTEWFRGRGDDDDDDRRIKTTGHILEWLCYSLSDEELRQPQTIRAVWYLSSLMYSNYDHEWEVGPRSHALHALLLYDERVFKPFDKEQDMASFKPRPATANRTQRRTTSKR